MEVKLSDITLLDDHVIVIEPAVGWGWAPDMMRAIISFSKKITPLIPGLSKVIPRCGYNSDIKTIMFRHEDLGVYIEPHQIVAYNVRDELKVIELLDWIKERMTADTVDNNSKLGIQGE